MNNAFITKSILIHNDKYNYDKTCYVNRQSPVNIICPEHGLFSQTPNNHLAGKEGCKECSKIKQKKIQAWGFEQFLEKARGKHKCGFSYNPAEYSDYKSKITVTCQKCKTSYQQTPHNHLQAMGCSACYRAIAIDNLKTTAVKANLVSNNNRSTKAKLGLLTRFVNKHGSKYDYSLVDYNGSGEKISILCPTHGLFKQTPSNHFKKGCLQCCESKAESEFSRLLKNASINFSREVSIPTFSRYKRFDFVLTDYEIYVELDGVQHFKPTFGTKRLEIQMETDKKTTEWCFQNKVKLHRIRYDETMDDSTVSTVLAKFGYLPNSSVPNPRTNSLSLS